MVRDVPALEQVVVSERAVGAKSVVQHRTPGNSPALEQEEA